jgi:hypothetical protein
VQWWASRLQTENGDVAARRLWVRLNQSLEREPERRLFKAYTARYADGFDLPALLAQVYLHYDPYTRRRLQRPEPLVVSAWTSCCYFPAARVS